MKCMEAVIHINYDVIWFMDLVEFVCCSLKENFVHYTESCPSFVNIQQLQECQFIIERTQELIRMMWDVHGERPKHPCVNTLVNRDCEETEEHR